MSLLTVSEVKKFYGRQDVLKNATFHINPGERVGLIGANGAGKTTLIRLILNRESPDDGSIHRSKALRLGHLPQDLMTFTGQTLLDLVMDTAEDVREIEAELEQVAFDLEEEAASQNPDQDRLIELTDHQSRLLERFDLLGGYTLETEARKILAGLGFLESDFYRLIDEFSGGWIMRAVLARLLLTEPDLLLLDEPTNHLDMDSLLWLENYLQNCASALLLVSHDRTFLNNVVQRIIEVERGEVFSYTGDFEQYQVEKEKRRATELGNYNTQQERIKQIERFIERNRVRKDRAKQVQSRIKMLEKMEKVEAPVETKTMKLNLPPASRTPDILVELNGVSKAYGRKTLYQDLDFTVRRGDRIAFLGQNGAGKSTLLKLLAGATDFQKGDRRMAEGVVPSYFAQFQLEELNPDRTVIQELDSVAGDLSPGRLRSILAGFLFREEDVQKKVAVLSGGEKTRLILAKIFVTAPNFLMLDEPSNHLDIPGREMLEKALREFSGSICLISHDRRLINAVANKVLIIKDGGVEVFPGNFDDYRDIWAERLTAEFERRETGTKKTEPAKSESRAGREARKRAEAEARQKLSSRRTPLIEKIDLLEREMAELGDRLDEVSQVLADPETYKDPDLGRKMNLEYNNLKAEMDRKTQDWEEVSLELEKVEQGLGQTGPGA